METERKKEAKADCAGTIGNDIKQTAGIKWNQKVKYMEKIGKAYMSRSRSTKAEETERVCLNV